MTLLFMKPFFFFPPSFNYLIPHLQFPHKTCSIHFHFIFTQGSNLAVNSPLQAIDTKKVLPKSCQ